MADIAHSTAPPLPEAELHALSGSSPPGGTAPTFEPVATAAEPSTGQPDDEADDPSFSDRPGPSTHPLSPSDRALVKNAKEVIHLARRWEHGSGAWPRLEQIFTSLTHSRPESLVALAMKADAYIDLATHIGSEYDAGIDELGLSIPHDAIQLAVQSTMRWAEPPLASWLDDVGDCPLDPSNHPEASLFAACSAAMEAFGRANHAWRQVKEEADDADPSLMSARDLDHQMEEAFGRVTAIPARTPEGLRSKASLLEASIGSDTFGVELASRSDLVKSIIADARWIGSRSRFTLSQLSDLTESGAAQAPAEGWAFHHLVKDWARAKIEGDRLYENATAVEEDVKKSGVPEALFVRPEDKELFAKKTMPWFLEREWYGHPETIKILRSRARKDDLDLSVRDIRIAEILTAYDEWDAAGPAAKQSRDAAALHGTSSARADLADKLEDDILRNPVSSLSGLLIKGQVIASFHTDNWSALASVEENIRDDLRESGSPRSKDIIQRDLIRLLISRNVTLNSLAGECAQERPAPDRRALYAYREWLSMEGKLLGKELFPEMGNLKTGYVPVNTGAATFHDAAEPPSARAARILAILGIDWTKDDVVDDRGVPVSDEPQADRSAA